MTSTTPWPDVCHWTSGFLFFTLCELLSPKILFLYCPDA